MPTSPILWKPPPRFDEDAPGLGLPQLQGISHRIIYDPKPSRANVDEGGDGRYESLEHGTFCHGPAFVILGDHIIARWSNHTQDEAGPGERAIARVGRFISDRDEIDWGGYERFAEIAAPPIPPRRRSFQCDPDRVWPYVGAGLSLINGSLYVTGSMLAAIGYTTKEEYRHTDGPIPAEHFSDNLDIEAGFNFDKWCPLGLEYVQKWRLDGERLVPDSPIYQRSPYREQFEVTRGRFKLAPPLQSPYTETIPFEKAPESIRNDVIHGVPVRYKRSPKFGPGTAHLSADGRHALAHSAEFRRPDGKFVVLRDNLLNPGYYYAAVKDGEEDFYPPAVETNLYGGANMAAGELFDGRPYIICNSYDDYYRAKDRSRKTMFITISKDGVTFDRTWLLLHIDRKPAIEGIYKFGGPQYFNPIIIERNMWVFYSITKEKIGLTKIPLGALGT